MKTTTQLLILLFLLTSQMVSGQSISDDSNEITRHVPPSSIRIVPQQPMGKSIEVSKFFVDSKIYGNLAQTTLTIDFYNPNSRNIAADFIFPIPINSTINGYALDINSVMVDGVAVEKNKARVSFEKIVRQGIDPGLIEKIEGNVFKARIFPIAAKQKRSIRIEFSSILSQNNDSYDYQIPLMSGQLVKEFNLKIQAINTAVKPIITSVKFKDLKFSQWNNAYVTELNKKDFTIEKPITIEVPKLDKSLVIVAKNSNDDFYFSVTPQYQDLLNNTSDITNKVNKIQLLWDASHSRYSVDHQFEIDLLDAFFKKYPNLNVELYLLRNTLNFENSYTVKNSQWNKLKQRLNTVEYDGATNFTEINSLKNSGNVDYVLLFSDGLHTFSSKQKVTLSVPLYVFTPGLSGNMAYSQQLAEQNNGQSFQLSNQQNIVSKIGQPVPQLISIAVNNGKVQNLPQFPYYLSTNPQPIIAKLLSDTAELTLNYGFSGVIKKSIRVTVNKDLAVDSDLPESIWAQQQLTELQKNAKDNKLSIITLSQNYNLVSDFTSLIVLENLQQYVEHKIQPPKSLPQMRTDYFAQLKQDKRDKHSIEVDKVQQVIAMWETRKAWWNKKFPKTPPKPIQNNLDDEGDELGSIVVTGSRMSAPAVDISYFEEPVMEGSPVSKKEKTSSGFNASVKISAWDPDTPYLKALKKLNKDQRLGKYYQLKKDNFNSPAFYFDCANFFFKNKQNTIGLQILSNIVELKIQDSRLLRTMAMKLKQHDYIDLSIQSYRKVLMDRPEEPQSYRDLALALQQNVVSNQSINPKSDYQEAITLFYNVISSTWDRFNGIEVTVLMEINQLLPQLLKYNVDYSFIDEKLIDLLDVDVRIVLGWDSDMTDIDLWVIEPSGEKVTYSKTLSGVGGMFHQDFTGGYGPEEYLIHRAPVGDYTVKVHFYGNNSPELSGATTLYVDVFTNFARPNQKKQTLSLRLENTDDDYLVGTINYAK